MLDSITNTLKQVSTQPLGLLLAMLLGVFSAATSACCTLPALGVLVGYSGSQSDENRNIIFKKAMFLILGTVVSLMVIGGVAGFVGQIAQNNLGRYWMIFAGIALIVLGLATLQLLPFQLSFGRFDGIKIRLGMSGAVLAGLALGGVVAANTLCCNPAIFIVIGVAVLQGQVIWAVLLLGMFAIGFSLPLGALSLGMSFGKARFMPKSANAVVRWLAGGIQLVVGFYFLITF